MLSPSRRVLLPLLARRGDEEGGHLVDPLLDGKEGELLLPAVGLDVDELPVGLVGLGAEVPVHLLQERRAVDGISRQGDAAAIVNTMIAFHDSHESLLIRVLSALIGSIRDALKAGWRLAMTETMMTVTEIMRMSAGVDAGLEDEPLLLAEVVA